MDKSKAYEILNDGKTNSATTPGTLVNDPTYVIQLVINGSDNYSVSGSFKLTGNVLDYAVHFAESVTLSRQDEYYANNDVQADVYMISESDGVIKNKYVATSDGWKEV